MWWLALLVLVSALFPLGALILAGLLSSLFCGLLLLALIRLGWSCCMIIVASVTLLRPRYQYTVNLGIRSLTSLDVEPASIELLLLVILLPLLFLLAMTLLCRVLDVARPRNSTSLLHFFYNAR